MMNKKLQKLLQNKNFSESKDYFGTLVYVKDKIQLRELHFPDVQSKLEIEITNEDDSKSYVYYSYIGKKPRDILTFIESL